MKIKDLLGTLNPFEDSSLGVHWDRDLLCDEGYKVGHVLKIPAGDELNWRAEPYWNLEPHFFDTREEAKAWLVAMYKMGGANEPKRRRRPAAK